MSTSYANVFSPNPVMVPYPQLLNLTLSGNTSLSWPTSYQNTNNVVASILYVSPTAGGFTLTLPQVAIPASGPVPAQPFVGVGESFFIANPTGNSFTLSTFLGGQTFNIASGAFMYFYLVQNTTSDGIWATGFPTAVSAVTSVGLAINASALGNLTVTSSSTNPITGAGTFTLALANDLLSLIGFGGNTGFAAHTAANTYALRTLTQTANQILIANPKGIAGDPVFSLAPTITGINNLTAGNINIAANTISATNNSRIILTPPVADQNVEVQGNVIIDSLFGTQYMAVNGVNYTLIEAGAQTGNITYTWPTVAPTASQVLQYTGAGTQLAWANVTTFGGASTTNAIVKFTNTIGSLGNTGVLIDNSNNITGATSLLVGNLLIGGAVNTNTIAATNINGNIILAPNNGETFSNNNLSVVNGSQLKFFPAGSLGTGNFVSVRTGALSATTQYLLPSAYPLYAQTPLVSDTAGNMSWNNIAVLTASVQISAAAIAGMYSVPVQIIQAQANQVIVVLYAAFYLNFNTAAFTLGGATVLQYNNSIHGAGTNALAGTIPATFIQSGANTMYSQSGQVLTGAGSGVTGLTNQGIFLSNQTQAFVAGGGSTTTLTVTVNYMILPAVI